MNIWDIIFDDANNGSGYDSYGAYLQQKKETEETERREKFNQALMKLFLGDEDRSGPTLLRDFVENALWFVPVNDDDSLKVVDVDRAVYKLAIGQPSSVKNKKHGKGGRLLPVYSDDRGIAAHEKTRAQQNKKANKTAPQKIVDSSSASSVDSSSTKLAEINGRTLARCVDDIAGGIDGFLLHLEDNPPLELRNDYFDELRTLAASVDLEEILSCPAPDQVDSLMQAVFLVSMPKGEPQLEYTDGAILVQAYTNVDKVSPFESKEHLVKMTGGEVFRLVTERAGVDGVIVNSTSKVGVGPNQLHRYVLSTGFAHQILKGVDIRPGANPLPARTFEEIKLWLRLRRFPDKNRKLIDAPLPDSTLVRAMVTEGAWCEQETLSTLVHKGNQIWSPVFCLPPDAPPQVEPQPWSLFPGHERDQYGPGATKILCAGLMASLLNPRFNADPKRYKLGRWFLIGRYNDDFCRRDARQRLALARELHKLLPAGEDLIPRSALLTVEGAGYLRQYPIATTRKWIEETIEHSARCTQAWVWFQ